MGQSTVDIGDGELSTVFFAHMSQFILLQQVGEDMELYPGKELHFALEGAGRLVEMQEGWSK